MVGLLAVLRLLHHGVRHHELGALGGEAIEEIQVQRRILLGGKGHAEGVLLEQHHAHDFHHGVQRFVGGQRRLALVPVLHGLQKIGDVLVEHGARYFFLVLEVVVEQRARHAHVVGDVLDGGAGQALLLVQLARGDDDLRRPLGRVVAAEYLARRHTSGALLVRLHEGPPVFKRTQATNPREEGCQRECLLPVQSDGAYLIASSSLSLSRQVSVTSLSLSGYRVFRFKSNGEFLVI